MRDSVLERVARKGVLNVVMSEETPELPWLVPVSPVEPYTKGTDAACCTKVI